MLERAKDVIETISKSTDEIILMHSLSGKDSIALLDLVYPKFKRVVCVFMYTVPNLRHIRNYYVYAKRTYPNIEFIQVPHYALFEYRKYGFMGKEGNLAQRKWTLSDIIDKVRERVGIEWVCLGFKQADSLNRRLMLRSYDKYTTEDGQILDCKMAISYSGRKFYPLSTYKNKDVIDYIRKRNLKNPEWFDKKEQSSGVDITDYHYLCYLRENYPDDLEKIYSEYPASRLVIPNTERELMLKKN